MIGLAIVDLDQAGSRRLIHPPVKLDIPQRFGNG
jgi:hypothetical protein